MTAVDERALEIHAHRRLCSHEAAHASVAMLVGLDVRSVAAPHWTLKQLEDAGPDSEEAAGMALIERPSPDDHDKLRKTAIVLLAGRLEEGAAYWPPTWPLSAVPEAGDEADLTATVKQLDLDEAGYRKLTQDARELTQSDEYLRIQPVIAELLEQRGELDAGTLIQIKENKRMQRLHAKAVATAVDEGVFEAVISTTDVDLEKDIVDADAMVRAIRKWTKTGKRIPVAWGHLPDKPADIIGSVDPASARNDDGEVVVRGEIDQSVDAGAHAWRLAKSGVLGFSVGFMAEETKRKGGGLHLVPTDVFEITATVVPANTSTRILALKEADDPQVAITKIFDRIEHKRARDHALRLKAQRVERENAPVRVAKFDC